MRLSQFCFIAHHMFIHRCLNFTFNPFSPAPPLQRFFTSKSYFMPNIDGWRLRSFNWFLLYDFMRLKKFTWLTNTKYVHQSILETAKIMQSEVNWMMLLLADQTWKWIWGMHKYAIENATLSIFVPLSCSRATYKFLFVYIIIRVLSRLYSRWVKGGVGISWPRRVYLRLFLRPCRNSLFLGGSMDYNQLPHDHRSSNYMHATRDFNLNQLKVITCCGQSRLECRWQAERKTKTKNWPETYRV